MFGIYNARNRVLSDKLYKYLIDRKISYKYKNDDTYGEDQKYLPHYVYPFIRENSIIHDSHLCNRFKDSEPFPTRIQGGCWVGKPYVIEQDDCEKLCWHVCPIECRPKDHLDWWSC